MQIRRIGAAIGATILTCGMMTGQAHASSITFTYNCEIMSATVCTAGGPYGTLVLTDSLIDPNRVDVDVVLNEAALIAANSPNPVNGLNNFFLNYSNAVPFGPNLEFKLVDQNALSNTFTPILGGGGVNFDNQGPTGTRLDIVLDPAGSTPSMTFSASLVLRSQALGHAESNLDVSMFDLKDANSLLYSAFNTLPTNHTFTGGSTVESIDPAAVPEPSSLVLLGSGLLGAIRFGTRLRTRKK